MGTTYIPLAAKGEGLGKLQRIKNKLIGFALGKGALILSVISRRKPWTTRILKLREMPTDTLGQTIAHVLDAQGYTLIPKFEDHDAHHVLLNYPMTGLGELRIQFFMLGNGHKTMVSIVACFLGLVVFPELYRLFWADFQRGKQAYPLDDVDFEKVLGASVKELRTRLKLGLKDSPDFWASF